MASEPGSYAAPPAAPPAGQQTEEPAGAEFFRRRLQRAMAIPPEQRDPAVHAFVTSVQLMEAAEELLPLTDDGQPALPADTLAGQQAELQAMLFAATALYTAVEDDFLLDPRSQSRVVRYVQHRGSLDAPHLPALQPLAGKLLRYLRFSLTGDLLEATTAREAKAEESSPAAQSARTALDMQLEQAQQGCSIPLLTAEQLDAAFQRRLASCGAATLTAEGRAFLDGLLPPAGLASLAACAALTLDSCEHLARLQPSNPKSLMVAAASMGVASHFAELGAVVGRPCNSAELQQRAWHLFLGGLSAARAQHSDYWAVQLSRGALLHSVLPGMTPSAADLAAVVAAAEQSPSVVKQLRRVLPQSWEARMEQRIAMLAAALPAARARLQALASGSTTSGAEAALDVLRATKAQMVRHDPQLVCSGCGQRALGLRRCSRCKQAAYCSRECQVHHWTQHKRECKAVSSSGGSRA